MLLQVVAAKRPVITSGSSSSSSNGTVAAQVNQLRRKLAGESELPSAIVASKIKLIAQRCLSSCLQRTIYSRRRDVDIVGSMDAMQRGAVRRSAAGKLLS